MTVRLDGPKTIEAAAKSLSISKAQIDKGYGVVEVDAALSLFAVLVSGSLKTNGRDQKGNFGGPFSNPRIEPFGPRKDE